MNLAASVGFAKSLGTAVKKTISTTTMYWTQGNMDLKTNTPKPGHGKRSQAQDIALIHHQVVLEDWLAGYRPGEISVNQGLSIEQVHGAIRSIRKQLYEDNQATLAEHSEQSVAVFRRLQTRLWSEFLAKLVNLTHQGSVGLLGNGAS